MSSVIKFVVAVVLAAAALVAAGGVLYFATVPPQTRTGLEGAD